MVFAFSDGDFCLFVIALAISRCGHIEVTFVLCYKANDAIKHCDLKHNGSKKKDTEITHIKRYIAVYLLDHQQDSANRRISQPIITAEINSRTSSKKTVFFFLFSVKICQFINVRLSSIWLIMWYFFFSFQLAVSWNDRIYFYMHVTRNGWSWFWCCRWSNGLGWIWLHITIQRTDYNKMKYDWTKKPLL